MPENDGSRPQKRTKMPILCSGMVAASPAAPTGAQHYPPRALRGASGSSAPGNRLPQPTTQPAVVHATAGNCPVHAAGHTTVSKQPGYLLPLIPPWRYRRGATAKKLTPAHLSPCMLPRPTCRSYYRAYPGQPTCRSYYRAYRCSATAGHTAVYATETYRQDLPAWLTTARWVPRPAGG